MFFGGQRDLSHGGDAAREAHRDLRLIDDRDPAMDAVALAREPPDDARPPPLRSNRDFSCVEPRVSAAPAIAIA